MFYRPCQASGTGLWLHCARARLLYMVGGRDVMLSTFFVGVSGASVNVALPHLMTAFGLNIEQGQWVLTAYMIAGAVLIPTVGWLGHWLGNRNLFLCSLLVFVGGSALCGLAWSGVSLITFRVLQSMGGGLITPMAMVFLTTAFPGRVLRSDV